MQKRKIISVYNMPTKANLALWWCWAITCKVWGLEGWIQAVGWTAIVLTAIFMIWYSFVFTEQVDIFKGKQ